jgi:restriction system protein
MPVALAYLEDCGLIKYRDMEAPLAKLFALIEEDVVQEYESGNGTIFLDRITWALSHMALAGLFAACDKQVKHNNPTITKNASV